MKNKRLTLAKLTLMKLRPPGNSDIIATLMREVELLGGPVCCACERNTARYSSGCCGLCDMQLPPEERGTLR